MRGLLQMLGDFFEDGMTAVCDSAEAAKEAYEGAIGLFSASDDGPHSSVGMDDYMIGADSVDIDTGIVESGIDDFDFGYDALDSWVHDGDWL